MKQVIILVFLLCVSIQWGCGTQTEEKKPVLSRQQKYIARGQELYFSHGCAVCHGKEGRGDGMAAARFYPKPIDLHDPDAYTQGNSVNAIQRSIKYGIRRQESAMPKYDHLTNEELDNLARYLESLQINKTQTGEKKP